MSDRFVGVLRAAWVLPIAGPPIAGGAVAVDASGRIAAVGPAEAVGVPAGGEVVDVGSAAVLPGLVNVHAHPELAALRGAVEDLPFDVWLRELVRHKYERWTPDQARRSTVRGVAEALAAGVTTLAAPDDAGFLARVLRDAGARGIVYREVFGPDPREWQAAFERARARVEEIVAHAGDLVAVGVAPHAPYTVSEPFLRAVCAWAREEGLPVCVHAAESEAEDRFVREGAGPFAEAHRARGIPVAARGASPVAWLEACGALGPRTLLVHCVQVDAEDVARIARSGAAVAHCPIANARLGHGVAPLDGFRDAGIRVGLGSDSAAAGNRMDLLEEARVAGLLQRATRRDPTAWPARELLRLVTLDGARALGLEHRVGSLAPGKDADLVVVRLAGPHVEPVHDPETALVHSCRSADVAWTMVRGRTLYRDGRWTTLDVDAWRAP
jgi:cytosine/adenosine deaminase-related metal-dependent hydrolase